MMGPSATEAPLAVSLTLAAPRVEPGEWCIGRLSRLQPTYHQRGSLRSAHGLTGDVTGMASSMATGMNHRVRQHVRKAI